MNEEIRMSKSLNPYSTINISKYFKWKIIMLVCIYVYK
jgi:hypothetical protein